MDYIVTGEQLTSIADKIREKSGKNSTMQFPSGFVLEINRLKPSIETENLDPVTVSMNSIKSGYVASGDRITSMYSLPRGVYIDENTVITAECDNPTYQNYYGNSIEGVYSNNGLYVRAKQAISAMTKGIQFNLTFTPIAKAFIVSSD